ncbi:hypothetical protein MOMUL_07430 [Moorella mulderi DSM 14980]|uniref:Uncharacterized protein n=1 Tax=Moorella mulderi DSM 14980 TaxID=1122241 RepID=A0A151AZ80_9FIRM|nr:hypothetical protein MOMUL_07430 [Moorella mulderi DSM 14980]
MSAFSRFLGADSLASELLCEHEGICLSLVLQRYRDANVGTFTRCGVNFHLTV